MSCHEPVKARGGLVACAYCPGCRARRSATWAVRLEDERLHWDRSCFLTLTIASDFEKFARERAKENGDVYKKSAIDDDDLPKYFRVHRRDLQLFFKRLRKAGAKFRYYAVGEYGEDFARAHYHVLLFGLDVRDRVLIERSWPFGRVDIGRVEPASIRYVTGYVMKAPLGRLRLHEERSGKFPPFSVMSQGLGGAGASARRHTIITQGVIRVGPLAFPPPRFYTSRLTREEKFSFLASRRTRQLDSANIRLTVGESFVVNDGLDRAKVSRADFRARQKRRGTL